MTTRRKSRRGQNNGPSKSAGRRKKPAATARGKGTSQARPSTRQKPAGSSRRADAADANPIEYRVMVRITERPVGSRVRVKASREVVLRTGPARAANARRRSATADSDCRLFAALGHPQRMRLLAAMFGGPASYRQLRLATGLAAGPLYHHVGELRQAGLITPKRRDAYELTPAGETAYLAAAAVQQLAGGQRRRRAR